MKKILLAAALSAACGMAAAQGYAGALIGIGKASFDCATGCDKSDTAFKAYVGYEVTPGWSVEGVYYDLGSYKADGSDVKLSAFGIGGAFRTELTQGITGVARLGIASIKEKGNGSVTRPYLGLGAEYALEDGITLTGNWDHLRGESGANVNVLGVGAQFGF